MDQYECMDDGRWTMDVVRRQGGREGPVKVSRGRCDVREKRGGRKEREERWWKEEESEEREDGKSGGWERAELS